MFLLSMSNIQQYVCHQNSCLLFFYSMEKLSDKVKKKIRHALLAMDNHGKSGMPAFQRAKPTGGSMRAHFYVSDPAESSLPSIPKASRGQRGSFQHANSFQVQWGSESRTCRLFKWSDQLAECLVIHTMI